MGNKCDHKKQGLTLTSDNISFGKMHLYAILELSNESSISSKNANF